MNLHTFWNILETLLHFCGSNNGTQDIVSFYYACEYRDLFSTLEYCAFGILWGRIGYQR